MLMSVRFEVQISRVARDAPVVIENESSIFSPSTPGVDVNGTGGVVVVASPVKVVE